MDGEVPDLAVMSADRVTVYSCQGDSTGWVGMDQRRDVEDHTVLMWEVSYAAIVKISCGFETIEEANAQVCQHQGPGTTSMCCEKWARDCVVKLISSSKISASPV